jgi:hypothetical protein
MSEIQGSGRWSIEASQRLSVEREYIVAWAGHAAWVASQIGTVDPLIPLCRCRQARVEPVGPISGPPATYTHARVTLIFVAEADSSSPQWPDSNVPSLPSGARVQVQVRGGGEFMLFPARDLRWEDNSIGNPGQPIPQEDSGVGRIVVPQQDWIITLSNLTTINRTKLDDRLGKVNQAAFLGYPAECVLFESYDVDWQWSLDNGTPKVTWSCAWHLKARAIKRGANTYGWNHEYRGPDNWKKVTMADGTPRYELANFSDLFT